MSHLCHIYSCRGYLGATLVFDLPPSVSMIIFLWSGSASEKKKHLIHTMANKWGIYETRLENIWFSVVSFVWREQQQGSSLRPSHGKSVQATNWFEPKHRPRLKCASELVECKATILLWLKIKLMWFESHAPALEIYHFRQGWKK